MDKIGGIALIVGLTLVILVIRYLVTLGVNKTGDAIAGALRNKNPEKYEESKQESLAARLGEQNPDNSESEK